MTIPLAQGDSEGWIIPSASRFRTSWLARAAFSGDMRLAPSRRGTAPGSISTGCLAMVHRPITALCFKNKSSNSVRMFSKEWLDSEAHGFFTSCSCDSGPGMGAISSGSVRFRFSRSKRPSSVGSVDDKN